MRNWFKKFFSGTPKLIKFIIRKEYVSSIIWIAAISVLATAVAIAMPALLPTAADLANMQDLFNNPAMAAMLGRPFSELSSGTVFASSMLLFTGLAVGLMNIFFVIRNTRGEEEKGREEVIRSLPVGRLSNGAATLIVSAAINAILAATVFLGLIISGYAFVGSILFGLALGVIGMFFAAFAAVLCQFFEGSRTAIGWSIAILLTLYVLRGLGDMSASVRALSYISPLGLMMYAEPFAANHAWPLLIILALSLVMCVAALWLNTVRDMGRGIIAESPGRSKGSFLMKTPEGLLFKLTRNSMLMWLVGMALLGIAYGSVMGEMETFIDGMGIFKEMLSDMIPEGHSLTEGFISMVVNVMVLLAAVPALMAILKIAGEEKAHRYDNILSKSVSRHRLLTTHLIFAVVQSILMTFVAALSIWAAASFVMDDPITLGNMLSMYFIFLPATLTMISLAALLAGVLPKKAALFTFAYLAVGFYVNYLGPMLGISGWAKYLTPYGVIPSLLEGAVSPWPFIVLGVLTVAMGTVSYITYKKRDIL